MTESPGKVQHEVARYYEEIGWKKAGDDLYMDAADFEDLRGLTGEYRVQCNLRLNRYLAHHGQAILDIASGPIQFPEYRTFSEGYDHRVCGDLSLTALTAAREVLGDHGLYVLCDITRLPFKEGAFDDVISLHTVYHVPADQQLGAFCELHRVLRPGARALVVYSWSRHSLLMAVTLPYKALVIVRRQLEKRKRAAAGGGSGDRPQLYFYVHRYSWFVRYLFPLVKIEVLVWRSVNVQFLKAFIRPRLFGRQILKLIYGLEERWPHFLGRFGAYPLFLISKEGPGRPGGPAQSQSRRVGRGR